MAKVVPLASAKAFLDALEKSSLLSADEVVSLRTSSGDEGDPRLIARDLVRENKLTKWQAGQLLHGFFQLIVGKYKLMDQLGTGEMGRVYLGEHAQLARKVSLKILSRKYTANPEILKKVLEDGRQAAALDHRNLSHVFDVNSEDDRYYLVTEYVEGKDLGKLVEASGATSPAQASDIVRQAAEGLEYAHSKGVNHGDLKPSNLIVDASGVVKILDLGLARLIESSPSANMDESTEVATLAAQSFHAPEQASKKVVSPLADVFSLGGILFYLLSGKPPLGGVKSAQDVKNACPAANDELTELCARMLAENPAQRPQSARDVIAGLEAAARAKSKPVLNEDKKSAKQKKPLVAKPLVAKPLEIPFPTAAAATPKTIPLPNESSANDLAAISLDDANMVEQPPPAAEEAFSFDEEAANGEPATDDPFAGFTLETKRKKTKPATKPAAEPAAAPAAAAPAAVPKEEAAPAPIKVGKKPSMAIVIGVGIGGGVLILVLGVSVLVWAMTRGKPVDKTAIANAENKQKEATTPPEEANPEANPELNPEANPTVEPPSTVPTKGPEKTTPAPTPEGPKTTVPMPMPGAGDPTKAGNPPMPMPPVTTPPPMPMPPKPEPVKPMPEPVVPVGDPFVGFAKVVTLPPLEEKGNPLPDATKPFLFGSIKLPPKALCLINLRGGDNAISTNAKQKFVMVSGNNGTAERDWDFNLVTEGASATVTIAKLSLQNDQLNFQWTDDAAKQLTAAPYLCNCALNMSAGMGSHMLSLRQPLTGEPLKIDLEKPMSAKFKIDYPPNPKQIVIQLGPPEGSFPKFRFEKAELTAKNDNTMFMTGPSDDVMLLHFKMVSAMNGPLLKIEALPNYQVHGMTKPEKYVKAKVSRLQGDAESKNNFAQNQQRQVSANLNQIPKERQALVEAELKKLVEDAATYKAQTEMLLRLVKEIQGVGKLHFHIYYEADSETKIDLISTGAAPPMAAAP